MEILREVAPDESVEHLEALMIKHNNDLDRVMDQLMRDRSVSNISTMIEKARPLITSVNKMSIDESQPNTRTRAFTGLSNGDCAPHSMGLCLSFLTKEFPSNAEQNRELGMLIRNSILKFQKDHWYDICTLNGEQWHEIIYASHNLGIPESELRDLGLENWGSCPDHRLSCWKKECDAFFFTVSELMAFCELLRTEGIHVVFRIYRTLNHKLERICCIPEVTDTLDRYLIFDFKHTGKMDTIRAHWQLLRSGSATPNSASRPGPAAGIKRKH